MAIPKPKLDAIFQDPEFLKLGDSAKDNLLSEINKSYSQKTVAQEVPNPSLLNEFMKANAQVASGARANLQGRSFESGFNQPGGSPRFQDTMPQGVMNLLEKSKFLREHPNVEQAAFQTLGAPAKLAGIATDNLTDPMSVAGGIVGNALFKPAVSGAVALEGWMAKKGGQLSSKLGLNYPEQLANLRAKEAMISQSASKEMGATEAQIKYNIGTLEQAKAQSISNMTNLTKEAEKLNAESITSKEVQKSGLGTKLPDVAYASGQKLKDRFVSTIRKHSELYAKKLDSLLGGKNADIYTSTDNVLSSIEDALLDRSVPTSFDDKTGKLILESSASTAEKRLSNLYNKLKDQTSVGIRDLIRNKQMLGRGVSYGKSYGYEDDLINDVVQRFGSRIEKELPGMKPLNQETSKFLRIKDEANARLDLFKQGSSKPREFVEKFAKSSMSPEERVFLEKLRTELPDFDRLAKAPRALGEGMKQYDDAIKLIKNKDPQAGIKIAADFDTEISKLNSNLDIIKARISNKAGKESTPLISSIAKIEKKIGKFKKAKDIIITAGALGGAGYGLRAALNYGFNAGLKD